MDGILFLRFQSPFGDFFLDFEDDGKVAYAYLKERSQGIVGDVWVYNRCRAPERSEWNERQNLPFANCIGFADDSDRLVEPINSDQIRVEWHGDADVPIAHVYVMGRLHAIVGFGDRPGASRLAIADGPLAKRMTK